MVDAERRTVSLVTVNQNLNFYEVLLRTVSIILDRNLIFNETLLCPVIRISKKPPKYHGSFSGFVVLKFIMNFGRDCNI